jgi:hypothetical protein
MEWSGYRNAGGYGVIGSGDGRSMLAHRKAWELTNGPIPVGMFVLHKCDNRACCNPEHLFVGTNDDNMKDMAAKGRGRSRPGQHSPNAKLTQERAREIRELYAKGGISQEKLGAMYGITQVGVSQLILGKKYKEDALLPKTLLS